MTNTILMTRASAALTETPNYELVKPTYGFINTGDIVSRFERQGWMLHTAKQARVNSVERSGYQKHLLTFRNDNFKRIEGLSNGNESIPELIVENSHDGTSALRLFFGVFRIACLNGIIAGQSLSHLRVIHSGRQVKNIDCAVENMTDSIPNLIEKVGSFGKIMLDNTQKIELAQNMAQVRLAHTPNVSFIDSAFNLRPRRLSDTSSDLFSVFNVVQEKVLRGGLAFRQTNGMGGNDWKKTRAISSVTQSVRLNRELWDCADAMAVSLTA